MQISWFFWNCLANVLIVSLQTEMSYWDYKYLLFLGVSNFSTGPWPFTVHYNFLCGEFISIKRKKVQIFEMWLWFLFIFSFCLPSWILKSFFRNKLCFLLAPYTDYFSYTRDHFQIHYFVPTCKHNTQVSQLILVT